MGESALYDVIHRLRAEQGEVVDLVGRIAPHLAVLREAITGTGKWSAEANRAVRSLADLAPEAALFGTPQDAAPAPEPQP